MIPGWKSVCKVAFKMWTQCLKQSREVWRKQMQSRGGGGGRRRRKKAKGAALVPDSVEIVSDSAGVQQAAEPDSEVEAEAAPADPADTDGREERDEDPDAR